LIHNSNTPILTRKTTQVPSTNKKIITQRRLYSTKKTSKVKKVLKIPNRTEKNHISASLIFKNNTTYLYIFLCIYLVLTTKPHILFIQNYLT